MYRTSKSCQQLSIKVATYVLCLLCHAEPARVSTKLPSETGTGKYSACLSLASHSSWQHVTANYTSRNRPRLATGQEGHT